MLNNKSILITGGTGSFGKKFLEIILKKYKKMKRVIIFSRDELKQFHMSNKYPKNKFPQIRFFIGDVRDRSRLSRALKGVDIVVHAAALKQVPAAEYNPNEFIKTNVIGAHNIIEACIDNKVKKIVALSTDKAAAPINLYGATKLCSDKLFTAAKNYVGIKNMTFSVVRYGNVLESRGSVIPLFREQKKTGVLSLTDEKMTRFSISLEDGVNMVLWSIQNALGGEIVVPKVPSFKIKELAELMGPQCKIKIIGKRLGEKIHEELITAGDVDSTYDIGKYFLILSGNDKKTISSYKNKFNKFKKIKNITSYNSENNSDLLTGNNLRNYLKKNKVI
jgi:UDP-N-acetylglucosamine 4,6-dehydratase (inverting)